jgi:hypothetical protein
MNLIIHVGSSRLGGAARRAPPSPSSSGSFLGLKIHAAPVDIASGRGALIPGSPEVIVEYATVQGDLLVHARNDWPCIVCRPHANREPASSFMCVNCAHDVITNSVSELAPEQSNWVDLGYALAELVAQAQELDCHEVN